MRSSIPEESGPPRLPRAAGKMLRRGRSVLMQVKDGARPLVQNATMGSMNTISARVSRPESNHMILPHVLKRITLHLARSKEFPSGSASHGYEFVAPLDPQGHIDAHLWQKYREHCGVRRFWNGDDKQIGRLVHKPGGAEHARWVFDYDAASTDDDEAGHRFGVHAFAPGEYVSIRDNEDELHTFRVTRVEPAT